MNSSNDNQPRPSDKADSDSVDQAGDPVPVDPYAVLNDLSRIEPAIGALRRQRLRVALKMMLGLGVFGVLYVFASAFFSTSTDESVFETMRVPIGRQAPATVEFYNWNGRPVLVMHRSAEQIASLEDESGLKDPTSRRSNQPEFAENSHRSRQPQWFVAIAAGTDLNCALSFLPPERAEFHGRPWPGGFLDTCRGARYDLSGRVFKDQHARKNLPIPPYAIDGDYLVLGGS